MKTIKKVTIEPIFGEYVPEYKDMEDGKVYISEKYESSSHRCLCGCGELVVLPLKEPYGWNIIKNDNGKVSFTPSVGNYQIPCKSHYIITNNIANFV